MTVILRRTISEYDNTVEDMCYTDVKKISTIHTIAGTWYKLELRNPQLFQKDGIMFNRETTLLVDVTDDYVD